MIAVSHSGSDLLGRLLYGPLISGEAYGSGHLHFGNYVVTITRRGSLRMPNGIECNVKTPSGEKVSIGGGRLIVGATLVDPGAEWDPVPTFKVAGVLPAGPEPLLLLPARRYNRSIAPGDCVMAGFIAGLVLLHSQRDRAGRIAEHAAADANPLTATLFRHAARGEVPESVHLLLRSGAPRLISTGESSESSWLRGLLSAGYPVDLDALRWQSAGRLVMRRPARMKRILEG